MATTKKISMENTKEEMRWIETFHFKNQINTEKGSNRGNESTKFGDQ